MFNIEAGDSNSQRLTEGDMLTSDTLIADGVRTSRKDGYLIFTVLVDNRGQDLILRAEDIVINDGHQATMINSTMVYYNTMKYCKFILDVGPDMDYSNGVYSISLKLSATDYAGDHLWTTEQLTVGRD